MANRSHTDRSRTRRWQLGLTLYATIFTGAYFTLEDYFSFFITSYAVVVAILVIAGIRISWGPDGSPTHRRLLLASAGLFVGSVFLLWFPEHVWFDCEHPVQKLQLHALWHLGAGLGTYLGFLCVLWDRLQQRQLNPQLALRSWLRIPTVTPGKQD